MKFLGSREILFVLVAILATTVDGKVFARCQLARELTRANFPRSFISNWVCLIENESGGDTTKTTSFNNLSSSYGIFQINSKDWCRQGRKGGNCNAKCEDFLDDDISDDIQCAKQIYNRHGFNGWRGWENRCKGRTLPNVSRC